MNRQKIVILAAVLVALALVGALAWHLTSDSRKLRRAETLLKESENLVRQGKTGEAVRKLERAIELAPEDPRLYLQLGRLLDATGEYFRALESFKQAARLAPEDPSPRLEAGKMALKEGRPQEAGEFFEEARKVDPGHIANLYQLGNQYAIKRQLAKAEEVYLEIIALSPDREPEAHKNLAFIYTESDDLAAAEQMLKKALELKPERPETYYNDLGLVLLRAERPSEARQMFEKALELNPAFREAWQNLEDLIRNPASQAVE